MSNVVQLVLPMAKQPAMTRHAALVHTFAFHRRAETDVFWLKENAELLNILECTGQLLSDDALAALSPVYQDLPARMEFFPQYYRFFLSIAMDMEALGMSGDIADRLVYMEDGKLTNNTTPKQAA